MEPLTLFGQGVVGAPAAAVRSAGLAHDRFWAGVWGAAALKAENERLRDVEAAAALYTERERALEQEIARLQELLALPDPPGRERVGARVLAYFPYEGRITLSVGSKQGIKTGMPVVSAKGLVGVIQTVEEGRSQANLLGNRATRVGAMIVGNPPQAGILTGEGPDIFKLEPIEDDTKVRVGDLVVTSGYSETIPANIPIGYVSRVDSALEFGVSRARVVPAARLDQVREVVVLR